ncbi:MAG: DUF1772 domain-containing protein [Hydrogenophaga sp.]|uniref:anthrone oxygenase family protein n=1 Tax=Hydrogenophaga sp. TaxID=1904254 RepID=UPI001D8F9D47|nr:anthrone oxygenase family protein [Hydrogenophaga sp.]MBX3608317.1 DUF1772 domain-containing protein [Hydrogenophaga sp.]
MLSLLDAVVVLTLVGAGLVTGLLFAFSLVVMRALQELPPAAGMAVMQRINVLIIRPLFMLPFLGTALLCLALALLAVWHGVGADSAWLLAGAIVYLVGPWGVTIVFNVPLNNQLARRSPAEAAEAWPAYVRDWLRWNHVRTALGAAAVGLLGVGLALGQSVM